MGSWDQDSLSEPQRKWFASLREGLERETGRNLDAWAEIARACPETRPRARLAWMKTNHGLGQNRASLVLDHAFPVLEFSRTADDPLWSDPAARAVFEAVQAAALKLDGARVGRRKGYTAFSRRYQFAAARPLTGGVVKLGLALAPDARPGATAATRDPWSERLTTVLTLASPQAMDARVAGLLEQAWARS